MKNQKKDPEIESKINILLGQMTLEEKIAQLQSCWMFDLQTKGEYDQSKVASRLKLGIGQITRVGGASTYFPLEAAQIYNRLQRFLVENTRLGIPAINHEECCAGLMVPNGSVFPQIIGLASTFQPELAHQMTNLIRKQMLAVGARQGLAPVLDVARDPRWGRIEETFGEDPTLVSQFGIAYIKGLQGDDLRTGVMATGKHFVGHSFSQGGLNCGPVHLGWRDIWDVYLAPFQAAIRDAGLATMMNAYPELDGEVVAASRRILTELLRDTLGFDGLVVSDYEAVLMIHNYHFAARTKKEAAIKALTAGIDVEMPTIACYGDDLIEAVKSGELSEGVVDISVRRHLQKKIELGLFDNPYVDEDKVLASFDTSEDRELAYQIAAKSLVLLKNDGILPIKPGVQRIAVIGPNADSNRCMMGDYSYAAVSELLKVIPDENASFTALTEEGLKDRTVPILTFLSALRNKYPHIQVEYSEGCGVNSNDESGIETAVQVAKRSEITILVLGGRSGLAPDCTTGEFRDATNLGLPGVQEKLATRILELGKPVILVLIDGRPVAIPDLVNPLNAILEAWVPGEEGGRAIVDVLFGDVNPSGKLPVSIPRSAGQIPVFYNHKPSGMHSNIYGDYVDDKVTPLFPFGYGLSYTQFKYQDMQLAKRKLVAREILEISFTVKNSGKCSGDEVAQLYIRDIYASMPRPVKELRGFIRLSLQPGESKKVIFKLPMDQLAFYNEDLKLIVEPGQFKVMVGSSSEDIRLEDEFEIIGKTTVEVKERIFVCPVDII